ncbi:MAG: hypothetical protein K0Q73_8955 [Paenibacillus sp.]|jgi:hypothetical protein|nr:hypothetical protein [Paenibacillus sp.]
MVLSYRTHRQYIVAQELPVGEKNYSTYVTKCIDCSNNIIYIRYIFNVIYAIYIQLSEVVLNERNKNLTNR